MNKIKKIRSALYVSVPILCIAGILTQYVEKMMEQTFLHYFWLLLLKMLIYAGLVVLFTYIALHANELPEARASKIYVLVSAILFFLLALCFVLPIEYAIDIFLLVSRLFPENSLAWFSYSAVYYGILSFYLFRLKKGEHNEN